MNKVSVLFRACRERLRARLGKGAGSGALHRPPRSITAAEASGTVQAEFEKALALHQKGEFDEAESVYRAVLRQQPDHSDALHYLGVAHAMRQRFAEASELMRQAIAIDPDNEAAHTNLGNVLKALNHHEDALVSYDRALALNPDGVEVLNNRGATLGDLGRHEEALESYGAALAIIPGYAGALFNRGVSLAALGRHQEALESFDGAIAARRDYQVARLKRCSSLMALKRFDEALTGYDHALATEPDDIEALFNRGVVLVELKRHAEAVASYDRALAIKPDFAEVLNNRGIALCHDRRYEEAAASYDRALAANPEYAEAFNNRGIVLALLGRRKEALASYDRATVINPGYADAFNNRGVLLEEMERKDEALLSYNRALEIMPDYPDALNNRGGMFRQLGLNLEAERDFSRLLELSPDFEYVLGNKFNSRLQLCNWEGYLAAREHCFDAVRDGKRACLPFALLVMSGDVADHLACARTFVAHRFPLAANPLWVGERYQHDRIRIAYLSADFHRHATAYLMAELFEKHDRNRFELSAWSFGPDVEDDMRKRLRQSFEQFHDVRDLGNVEVAAMLRKQEIDIAIDLKGFTQRCRPGIFAHRPAPIQVNYLGYPGTMGADFMDYIIGDAVVIPVEHETFYAEKVVRLHDTYQVNDSKRVISERTPSRAEMKLPESGFVFCCFNNSFKITPDIFDIWMRLLRRVEGSVLWLLEDNAEALRNLKSEAETRGVRAERLVFAPRMALPDHLARHRRADLFLDTLPYNAHTTTSDALWVGLPVLTCMGSAFPGRVAASLLRAVGLPELIADNLTDYEALALKLATTPAMLNELKAKLARNRATHPLFDADRFRRQIESAYITMYERYQRGDPPQGFSVQTV